MARAKEIDLGSPGLAPGELFMLRVEREVSSECGSV